MGDYSDYDGLTLLAVVLVLGPLLLLISLAGYVISSFFLMKIFEKAGVQGKWRAWVPVYNILVLSKLGDVSPWLTLGGLVAAAVLGQIPVIGLVGLVPVILAVMYSWRVGLKFGKEWYLLLLFLIPGVGTLIWLGILAFSHSRWNPDIGPSPWNTTFLADKTVWNGVPVQPAQPVPGAGGGYPPASGYGQQQNPHIPPAGGYPPPPAPGSTPPPPAGPQV